MNSDEAVEAAAKAIASANLRSRLWTELDDESRNHFRRDAKAAIEAAAPHMLAEVEAEIEKLRGTHPGH